MNDGSVSFMARLRAGLASMLASLAGGARRMEHWSTRGTRPILLGLVAIAVLAFGALAIVSGGHAFGGGRHGGPHAVEAHRGPGQPPAPKPSGKPETKPVGKPIGKPERPAPPAPPVAPDPPAPPVGVTQP